MESPMLTPFRRLRMSNVTYTIIHNVQKTVDSEIHVALFMPGSDRTNLQDSTYLKLQSSVN